MEREPKSPSPPLLKRLGSYLFDQVVERSSSPHNPVLEVCLSGGKYVLHAERVNLSFGELDKVFRSAFTQLNLEKRDWERVLLLGVGAGNVVALLHQYERHFSLTGVEIDHEVIRLANKYFGLTDYPNTQTIEADATRFMREAPQRYDLIIVDLFIDETIPERAQESDFLKHCDLALRPGGLLLFNRLMHKKKLQRASERFTRKMQEVLPGTRYLRAHTNRILFYEKD